MGRKEKGNSRLGAVRLENKSLIGGNYSSLAMLMEKNLSRNLYSSTIYSDTGSKKSANSVLSSTESNQIFNHLCVPIESANPIMC